MRRQHPPGDDRAAAEYAAYLEATDPDRQFDPESLGVEPDFPTEVFES